MGIVKIHPPCLVHIELYHHLIGSWILIWSFKRLHTVRCVIIDVYVNRVAKLFEEVVQLDLQAHQLSDKQHIVLRVVHLPSAVHVYSAKAVLSAANNNPEVFFRNVGTNTPCI